MRIKYFFVPLWGLLSLLCSVCSCSTGEAAAQILGTVSVAPVFLSCAAVSGTEINFEFSLPVKVVSLSFSPSVTLDALEEGALVRVHYSGGPAPGERLTADLLAEDENGNTINVLVPLRTRNDRVPRLLINELRTEYSKSSYDEFIEMKILDAGNMGALRVFIAGNNKAPLVYEFSPLEVSAGEYIVLHLRTLDETNRDEYGSSPDESAGALSLGGVRDFWVGGNKKLLHKTDAVYVLDQGDEVLDAVMLAENPDPVWNKDYLARAAEFLLEKNAWKAAEGNELSPRYAVPAQKTTTTRSVSRDETVPDSDTRADWYVTATSGATPGKPNNPKRFQ